MQILFSGKMHIPRLHDCTFRGFHKDNEVISRARCLFYFGTLCIPVVLIQLSVAAKLAIICRIAVPRSKQTCAGWLTPT